MTVCRLFRFHSGSDPANVQIAVDNGERVELLVEMLE